MRSRSSTFSSHRDVGRRDEALVNPRSTSRRGGVLSAALVRSLDDPEHLHGDRHRDRAGCLPHAATGFGSGDGRALGSSTLHAQDWYRHHVVAAGVSSRLVAVGRHEEVLAVGRGDDLAPASARADRSLQGPHLGAVGPLDLLDAIVAFGLVGLIELIAELLEDVLGVADGEDRGPVAGDRRSAGDRLQLAIERAAE